MRPITRNELLTETLRILVISVCLGGVFAGCTNQPQNQQNQQQNQQTPSKEPSPSNELLTARVESLERDLQRFKNEVVQLQFKNHIDEELQLLNPPSPDCEFVISEWTRTQETLQGFMNDSAGILKPLGGRGPDPRMQSGIKRLLFFVNKTCKSNLLFNAEPSSR